VVLVGAIAAASALFVGSGWSDAPFPTPGHVHVMKVFRGQKNAGGAAGTSNMTYHGGPVETQPKVYLDFWGSWWSGTVTTGSDGSFSYTNQQAMTYVKDFFTNVGGSSWANIATQYCQGVITGTVNCGSSGTPVGNPSGQLAGWFVSTNSVPSSPSQSQIAAEAQSAASHFGYSATSQPGATIFVLTPSGSSMSGFATSWCAWHSVTTYNGQQLPYAYVPYQPDAGLSCGENFVNTPTAYGNGYFDGFSVVGGHEYVEAETDPVTSSGSYAWYDTSGSEIGDKCAWSSSSTNISLGGNQYAIQPMWSNASTSCVNSYSGGGGGAPTGVTTNAATGVSSSGATLNGAANPNGLSTTGSFRYYSSNPGACTTASGTPVSGASIGSGTTSQTFSGSLTSLSPSTQYWYCAIANNSSGTTLASNVASFTTLASGGVPSPPTGVTARRAEGIGVRVSWTASSGSSSYNVYRTPSTSSTCGTSYSQISSTSSTSLKDTSTTRGSYYCYEVTAVNSSGESGKSAPSAPVQAT
jgi:hypothetical protein